MPRNTPDRPGRPGPSLASSPSGPEAATVAVLGIGQMGLVCAGLMAAADSECIPLTAPASPGRPLSLGAAHPPVRVVMWGHSEDEAGSLTQTRTSGRLPGFILPEPVRVTSDLSDALSEADLVVCAIPVQFIRDVFLEARGKLRPGAGVVSVSKGIENGTLLRPTQVVADALRDDPDARPRPIGVLSGPAIAAELARCLPAIMVAASDAPGFAAVIQRLFSTSYLRIYTHEDVLGVELAGATKNVIAIAAGVVDGLQAGYNAKSALLARGLAEITRLGVAMGSSTETFFGLAGVGDLATTCFSPEGRNRSLGEALGRGQKLDDYLRLSRSTVEGVATTRSVMDLAAKYRVDMPITAAVHAVLFEGLDPLEAIGRLMSREMKAERVG